jgi:integrase
LTHRGALVRNSTMKTPKPREWADPKNGKIYWRIRWNDVNGKETVKVFGTPGEAEAHVKVIMTERKRHGRAAAVNSDEVAALAIWREFVANEHTAGRDAPALRDVLRSAIERLKNGTTSPSLENLHVRFLEAKKSEGVSTRHYSALKNRVGRFTSYFDSEDSAGALSTMEIEKAMASMRASGLSAQTVKGVRTAAHGLFQWAVDRDLISNNPVSKATAPKVKPGEVGIISESQFRGLLKTALATEPKAVPPLAVWGFCGVRRAELCRLRYNDIDLDRKELRVSARVAKSGVARFVPIPEALVAWLEAAAGAGVAPIGKLVPGGTTKSPGGKQIPDDSEAKSEGQLNRWLREIRPKAGIMEWPNNALRHSFASHAAAMHEDFAKVAAWLGHARDPSLLIARYRHAVPMSEGEKWFKVLPTDEPAKEKTQDAEDSQISPTSA